MRQRVAGVVGSRAAAVMMENIARRPRAIYPFLAANAGSVTEADSAAAAAAAAEARVHDVVDLGSEIIGQTDRSEVLIVGRQGATLQQNLGRRGSLFGQEQLVVHERYVTRDIEREPAHHAHADPSEQLDVVLREVVQESGARERPEHGSPGLGGRER